MERDQNSEPAISQAYEAYSKLGEEVPFAGDTSNSSEQSKTAEFIERDKFGRLVHKIADHPGFSFEDAGQPAAYDGKKIDELYDAMSRLKKRLDSEHTDLEIPDRLETILADDAESYPFNHNYRDITARTAHGLLCGDGSNCIGFSETICIMLSLYGYKPAPVLSRLNKTGAAPHYVTCFENKDGRIEILDPERKRSCDEVEKQYSLTAYQGSLRYAVPTKEFSKVKISGPNGTGPIFDEYFSDKPDEVVRPITEIMKRLDRTADDMKMYEKGSAATTRIELKKNSMSSRKKELLDSVISDALRPIYEESLALMSEEE